MSDSQSLSFLFLFVVHKIVPIIRMSRILAFLNLISILLLVHLLQVCRARQMVMFCSEFIINMLPFVFFKLIAHFGHNKLRRPYILFFLFCVAMRVQTRIPPMYFTKSNLRIATSS